MLSLRVVRSLFLFMLAALLCQPEVSRGQAKTVSVETIDGVSLNVHVFKGNKGKDGVTILMLHHFDEKGGDGLTGFKSLAEVMQKAGHTVVCFDFRGHGSSTSVDKDKFWNSLEFPGNAKYIRRTGGAKMYPETISHSEFLPGYYPFLVNDIAAVRSYLDRLNDSNEVNTSNIVVVAAGQGATLAALWAASEFQRRQAVPMNPLLPFQVQLKLPVTQFELREKEGKDIAAVILLSPSPTLGKLQVPILTWTREIGKEQKVPLAFIYGKEDKANKDLVTQIIKDINPRHFDKTPGKDFEFLKDFGVDTKLSGTQLLDSEFPTQKWITTDFLNKVFEERKMQEPRTRSFEKFPAFWYTKNGAFPVRLRETDKAPRPLPLSSYGLNR